PLGDQHLSGCSRIRRFAGEHFVQHAAEAVHVGASIQGSLAHRLLRTHVGRRPHREPRLRESHPCRGAHGEGDPEIGAHRLAVLGLTQNPVRPESRRQLRAEHLERHLTVMLDVVREIDGRHAAAPQLSLDDIAAGEGGGEAVALISLHGSSSKIIAHRLLVCLTYHRADCRIEELAEYSGVQARRRPWCGWRWSCYSVAAACCASSYRPRSASSPGPASGSSTACGSRRSDRTPTPSLFRRRSKPTSGTAPRYCTGPECSSPATRSGGQECGTA